MGMGAGSDTATVETDLKVPDEEKARLEGLTAQNGPLLKPEVEPGTAPTPDSELPKVSRDPGV